MFLVPTVAERATIPKDFRPTILQVKLLSYPGFWEGRPTTCNCTTCMLSILDTSAKSFTGFVEPVL